MLLLCLLWELGSPLVSAAHVASADLALEQGEHGFYMHALERLVAERKTLAVLGRQNSVAVFLVHIKDITIIS